MSKTRRKGHPMGDYVEPLKVTSLHQTCMACPSQWEGHVEDGRMFYIRYRWGTLTLNISDKPTDNINDAVMANELHHEGIGGPYDGTLTTEEMKEKLNHILDFDET